VKKHRNRYTLCFRPNNPAHRKAMDILDSAGARGKADAVAYALAGMTHIHVDRPPEYAKPKKQDGGFWDNINNSLEGIV